MADNVYSNGLASASTQYLYANDSVSLSVTGSLTIECWVYFTTLPSSGSYMSLVSKYYDTGNQRSYNFNIRNDSGTYKLGWFHSQDGTAGAKEDSVTVDWTPSTSTWYHLASVYDASTPNVTFYVNGSQQGSPVSVTQTSTYDSNSQVWIGALQYSGGTTWYLNGLIDEIRIWAAARTQAQISAFKQKDASAETGLKCYLKSENNYNDASGNSNAFAGYSSPTFSTTVPFANYSSGNAGFFNLM